jgi:hypothetical protein
VNCQDRSFILFSSIVGIAHHPRAVEKATAGERPIINMRQAATSTLEGMDEFRRLFGRCDDPGCRHCANG